MPYSRIFLSFGAFNAALAVAMAAASSHAPSLLAASHIVQPAIAMQQLHALGLIALGVLLQIKPGNRWWHAAGGLFALGLVLFCFNLYARALFDFNALRSVVPAGGTCFIVAWLVLAVGAWKPREEST